MQDSAAVHTCDYSINDINKVSEDTLTSFKLWPAVLNSCEFYMWGSIKTKHFQIMPTHWRNLITTSVKQLHLLGSELKLVSDSAFKRLDVV
jgi:hypothetical protein